MQSLLGSRAHRPNRNASREKLRTVRRNGGAPKAEPPDSAQSGPNHDRSTWQLDEQGVAADDSLMP